MKRDSYIADLRKRAGLTQKQLGEKLGLPESYGQKKISQWESDIARPDLSEIEMLAKVLKVPQEQLAAYFTDPSAQAMVELFTRLAASERPSLFAVCYSGRPRILSDPIIRTKFDLALKRNLFVAMFVPFPLVMGERHSGHSLLLAGYYARVWGSVLASRERFRAGKSSKDIDSHLAIYGPKCPADTAAAMVPPFVSRYSLLIEKNEMGAFDKSLYLAVEASNSKQMQLVGSDKDEFASEQIQDWEAYYSGVVEAWMDNISLPRRDCGEWQYINEPTPPTNEIRKLR